MSDGIVMGPEQWNRLLILADRFFGWRPDQLWDYLNGLTPPVGGLVGDSEKEPPAEITVAS